MRTNDGDVIVAVTPRPAPIALARCVLPAPRSPHRQMRSPAAARPPRAAGRARTWPRIRAHDGPFRHDPRRHHPKRSRSPRATVATDPSSSRMRPGFEMDVRHRTDAAPAGPSQRPSRPSRAPPRTRTKSAGGVGRVISGASKTSVGGSPTIATSRSGQHLEDVHQRTGHRAAVGAVHDQHGVRRQPVEGGSLACLGREEVASFLARESGHDDPADAHRPSARQRLGIDPRADDEDRAGQARRRGRRVAARRWRRSPSAACPRVGPPRVTTPRMPWPVARRVMDVPGWTSRTMPGDRRLERIRARPRSRGASVPRQREEQLATVLRVADAGRAGAAVARPSVARGPARPST